MSQAGPVRAIRLTHAGICLHDGSVTQPDMEDVFKALADRSRRHLLDLLRERDGQTLGELAAGLAMARQSASQHLSVLESANLISVVWQGRLKIHYLNPVPLHEIQERWIDAVRASASARAQSCQTARRGGPDDDQHNTTGLEPRPTHVQLHDLHQGHGGASLASA